MHHCERNVEEDITLSLGIPSGVIACPVVSTPKSVNQNLSLKPTQLSSLDAMDDGICAAFAVSIA
jgi:hypothetical protein